MDLLKRKKILVFIDWFYPGYKAGGPIQSCVNFAYAMQHEYEVYVFTSDTDHGETVPYDGIEKDNWMYFGDTDVKIWYAQKKHLSTQLIYNVINEISPDFIYLNSMYSFRFVLYPLWLKYLNKLDGKVILCPRGALYDSALAVKKWKKIPFLKIFNFLNIQKKIVFQATNTREYTAIDKYFKGSTIKMVDDFMATKQDALYSCPKITGMLKLIFIARIFPIKNLYYVLECLSSIQASINFTIVGPIEDAGYWERCQEQISNLPANITVTYLGPLPNIALPALLKENHLYVLPTTGESFGHSIFESFLAGRPVLISDQTPWQNLSIQKVGWDIPLNLPTKFCAAIEEAASWNQEAFDEYSLKAWHYANDYIKSSEILEQYRGLFL